MLISGNANSPRQHMGNSETKLPPSHWKIVGRIRKVRKAGARATRSEERFADYRYLRSVLRAYEYLSDNELLTHLAVIAPSELMTPVRAGWHPIRIIIEASCSRPDLRMRSRWTRALEYALARKVAPSDLSRFFRANSGVAGCADLAGKTGPKRRRSEVRK
jgi:hypothetical protein